MGSAVSWNTMLIIGDYYYKLFPRYHPERVLTVICQTFAIGSMAILTYKEAITNTPKRNIIGYTLFCVSTLILIVLDLATSGQGGIGPYIGICVIVVAFGVATALVQGGGTGDLSFMSPEFVRSFIAGLAASGVLTSALRLMTKAVFGKSDDGERNGASM
ncbi:equilibrative nucleotide transporter 3 [Vitis vinifera]|uniref:equilibrative nucleotide transporter 3 n=1 Tax=Vitis vinifera TaxID=29760 RepID=UPI0028832947|nr:equilibrative nucleotide transporter 3 [Vitis vinifera]